MTHQFWNRDQWGLQEAGRTVVVDGEGFLKSASGLIETKALWKFYKFLIGLKLPILICWKT